MKRWVARFLFKLRLSIALRQIGVAVPWTLDEIEHEWFRGVRLGWDERDVELAFDVSTTLRGLKWVLGTPLNLRDFAQFPDVGRRGGYSEFLRVYWFGIRMASIKGAPGSEQLVARVVAGDPDASEEATAIYLLRSQCPATDLEIEPTVQVKSWHKKPDFRIRLGDGPWVYVEVTRLHESQASERVQGLLARVVNAVMAMEKSFLLEIILNCEPTPDEERVIVDRALEACEATDEKRIDVGETASILVKSGDPRLVIPSLTPNDNRPRMAVARSAIGPGIANRQMIARVPFVDERAEDILRREAKQLPSRGCGLLMANVNSHPSAFESWSARIPERFAGGQHTRVAGVILFMNATTGSERGLVWLPFVRLIQNPMAAVPLPAWITDGMTRIRDKTRGVMGRSD